MAVGFQPQRYKKLSFVLALLLVVLLLDLEDDDDGDDGDDLRLLDVIFCEDYRQCPKAIFEPHDQGKTPIYGGYSCNYDVNCILVGTAMKTTSEMRCYRRL